MLFPPDAVNTIDPVLPPVQAGAVVAVEKVTGEGADTVTDLEVDRQPLASFANTVYEPPARLPNVPDAEKLVPLLME